MALLTDGFVTIITLVVPGLTPVVLKEREFQPMGVEGGGPIQTETMRNARIRTKAPKSLLTYDDIVMQCQYDPAAYLAIITTFLQKIILATITFPDGTNISIYVWLESFKPASHKEGDFPLAEVKFCIPGTDAAKTESAAPGFTM
jgi:hypothetical protein